METRANLKIQKDERQPRLINNRLTNSYDAINFEDV